MKPCINGYICYNGVNGIHVLYIHFAVDAPRRGKMGLWTKCSFRSAQSDLRAAHCPLRIQSLFNIIEDDAQVDPDQYCLHMAEGPFSHNPLQIYYNENDMEPWGLIGGQCSFQIRLRGGLNSLSICPTGLFRMMRCIYVYMIM